MTDMAPPLRTLATAGGIVRLTEDVYWAGSLAGQMVQALKQPPGVRMPAPPEIVGQFPQAGDSLG